MITSFILNTIKLTIIIIYFESLHILEHDNSINIFISIFLDIRSSNYRNIICSELHQWFKTIIIVNLEWPASHNNKWFESQYLLHDRDNEWKTTRYVFSSKWFSSSKEKLIDKRHGHKIWTYAVHFDRSLPEKIPDDFQIQSFLNKIMLFYEDFMIISPSVSYLTWW